MPQRLFISDLHLSDERSEALSLFLKFLNEQASQATELYILGDFFDAWVGDDDDSQTAQSVSMALKQLSDTGVKVFIMHGNRDFLIGPTFCKKAGAELLDDPSSIFISNQTVLLTHGDQLCTQDIAYQKARKMRTEPAWLNDFLSRPLAERKQIAAHYRAQSGEAKSLLAEDIMDVSENEVIRWFTEYDCLYIIHGHTHRPARHQHDINGSTACRIVLDQWHSDQGMALSIDDDLNISDITIT